MLLSLFLLSCHTEKTSCSTLVTSVPENQATEVYYRDPVALTFDMPVDPAAIQTTAKGGWSLDGSTLIFTPEPAFPPSSTQIFTLKGCGELLAFTTSAVGTPADPEALTGNTYAVDLSGGQVIKPEGVGMLMATLFNDPLLMGIVEATETSLSLLHAGTKPLERPPVQDFCTATTLLPAADFSQNPWFQAGPVDISPSILGVPVHVGNFQFSGDFLQDGSAVVKGHFTATVDGRDAEAAVPEMTADAVCSLLQSYGSECVPCSDGEIFCVDVEMIEVEASLTEGELVDVEASQCPDCEEGVPVCSE
jgi:hypothetical protein